MNTKERNKLRREKAKEKVRARLLYESKQKWWREQARDFDLVVKWDPEDWDDSTGT